MKGGTGLWKGGTGLWPVVNRRGRRQARGLSHRSHLILPQAIGRIHYRDAIPWIQTIRVAGPLHDATEATAARRDSVGRIKTDPATVQRRGSGERRPWRGERRRIGTITSFTRFMPSDSS